VKQSTASNLSIAKVCKNNPLMYHFDKNPMRDNSNTFDYLASKNDYNIVKSLYIGIGAKYKTKNNNNL